ncbi:hypothetical protein BC938DRAFT_472829 [Jimgerdemannia flammicorona]|uniref:Uncharacterized protein n=1 Tax=Jimgerdemannia flammicorona TaxID=994334 RepID=A0A433Q5A7_9FUNG|nr:hypothetical protein BC938DRAFT_472829 [Jimgerdemannia flammicorona]
MARNNTYDTDNPCDNWDIRMRQAEISILFPSKHSYLFAHIDTSTSPSSTLAWTPDYHYSSSCRSSARSSNASHFQISD